MSGKTGTYLKPEEYLAIERRAELRSEYFDGEMIAMTGSSRKHNLIVSNIIGELRQQLKGKSYELYANEMRVRIPAVNIYTYPDVVVVCAEPKFEGDYVDTLLNPTLIIEVLSESTESYDRGKNFGYYRTLESLAEYLIIAQDDYIVEQYVRQPDDRWLLSYIQSLEGAVELVSIQCILPLKEVYDKVVLP
jgi:Uma2 family endonuclease